MKNQTNNKPAGLRKKRALKEALKAKQAGESLKSDKGEDDLLVIRDAYSHKEYYLSVIDTFLLQKSEYFVMYNYVPDNGNHNPPELVIMRAGRSPTSATRAAASRRTACSTSARSTRRRRNG